MINVMDAKFLKISINYILQYNKQSKQTSKAYINYIDLLMST